MTERRIDIRWADIDSSQHVNNAVYLSYLEEARTAFVVEAVGGERVAQFVLAHVEIDYRREVTLADGSVVARCRLESLGSSSVRTVEQVVTAAGALAAEAKAVIVAQDPRSRRSRPLTEAERAAFQARWPRAASAPR